ncbi:hypothetical protein PanWU01x14_132970 [Parasponia andersonii]|uniref:Uncharacterized protein n=1 Tax=Parasponia andersonii TaxID=3476 RepID=A0A2P5CQB1_PARAD|nr:hypothetical protein PanWU01x14_132970 [Parasponia andersonii]
MEDFYLRAMKYMHMENAQHMVDSLAHEETTKKKVNNQRKRDDDQQAPISPKKNQRKPYPDERRYPRTPKFTYYTKLNDSREHRLLATEDKAFSKELLSFYKGKGERKDQNKYCLVHHDHSHDTHDYFDLKDEIEGLSR